LRLRSRKVPDKYGRRQSALWYLSPDKKRYAVCFPAPLQSAGPVTMPRYGVPGGVCLLAHLIFMLLIALR